MRKPTDICLLCQVNLATKTNSHILPKFLSTKFLKRKGKANRGFDLSGEVIITHKPKVIQDSPKENYILCEECEKYFSVLEGINSDTFINWQSKVQNGEYSQNSVNDEMNIVDCKTANKKSVQLLIYSIYWRASISEIDLFENFKIEKVFEEDLRKTLMNYRHDKKTEFLNALIRTPDIKVFPTSITTAKSFNDETHSILFTPFSYSPYSLIVDRFGFLLFKNINEIKPDFIKSYSNLTINDCKIICFSEQLWFDIIVKKPLEIKAKQVNSNTQ